MSETTQPTVGDRYVLAVGEAGARRLQLLDRVYGPATRRLLADVGLRPGMHVLDVGCGTGPVTRFLATTVGNSGSALGIDIAASQLEIARAEAATAGLTNITFREAGAYDTRLPRSSFDLVFCRLVLCHLNRPLDAIREMAAILKPGGILCCQDLDLGNFFAFPRTAVYEQMRESAIELGRRRGVDFCLGPKLPSLFREAGFPQPEIRFDQPVYLRGEEKRFWEYTFLEAEPAFMQTGTLNREGFLDLARGAEAIYRDETIMVAQACMPAVWATKG